MKRLLLAAFWLFLTTVNVAAQDSVNTNPDKYKGEFGNERVGVLEYLDKSGEEAAIEPLPRRVVYALSTFKRKLTPGDYLSYVRRFADTLLARGTDRFGARHLPMWAGLIDTRDYSVPTMAEAERTKGGEGYYDEIHRRAVGCANIYHDLETLRVFEVLSALAGDPRYARSAREYLAAFLSNTQNEDTGLLGWGEHLYYDFYEDRVNVGAGGLWHEFLAKTPIWEKLWRVSPERTRRAIQGLRYHFKGPHTQTYLFNRHALWSKDTKQPPESLLGQYQYGYGQPWIKHSALLAYSLMFLHARTGDPQWLQWALGVGNLYWDHRDRLTNLTVSCIDDPRPTSGKSSLVQTTYLAYWLYKASELHPAGAKLRKRALTMFSAVDRHAWRREGKFYFTGAMNLDGTRFDGVEAPHFNADFGRTAAYFAHREKDPHYLRIARRMIDVMERDALPKVFFAEQVASRIHLLLDVYDLTGERGLVDRARRYADGGIAGLWRQGLFARRVGDHFYESKDGVGNFVWALLRLHVRWAGRTKQLGEIDWSY